MSAVPFGPFTLLDALASGGMGEVWLASPWGLPSAGDDVCVVKRVKSTLTDDDDTVRRFVDESRLGLLLRHPCVCRTLDAGRVDGSDYLAVELVEGVDVRTLVERAVVANRPIDPDMALWIVASALDGLSYANEARHPLTGVPLGVVHRDVSPHNLMAAKDGIVRVIDFGLALSSVREARTEQGIVLGKLAYMSPEQARGDAVDAAADVYAAGVVLYELLTGERYWGTLSSSEIWSRIGFGTHVPGRVSAADELSGGVLSFMTAADQQDRIGAAQARDLLLTSLRARGGADAARRRLASLVQALAAPELARMAQARVQASSQAPTLHDMPRTTISLALSEVRAVEALLRTLPPNVVLEPVTTTTLPPRREPRRVPTGAAATELVPRQPLQAVVMSPALPSTSPTASSPPATPPGVASSTRAALAVGLAAVVAVVVVALAWVAGRPPEPTPTTGTTTVTAAATLPAPPPIAANPPAGPPPPPEVVVAPPPTPIAAPPATPPPTPTTPTTPTTTTPTTPTMPTMPTTVPKKPDALLIQVQKLAQCGHPCAAFFKPIAAKGIAGLTAKERINLQTMATNCRQYCR